MSEQVTVTVPAALRPQVEGQESVAADGATVGEVLTGLRTQYPSFGDKLFPGGGEQINRSINIYVNEEDIRFLDNFGTPVTAKDQVDIILAIAGG
ncbi:MoaD/ThiS family protein [Phycisphaeraceae bacterium D3-23]